MIRSRLAVLTAAAGLAGAAALAGAAGSAHAQSPAPIKTIGAEGNPPRVIFECATPTAPPVQMEMVLRKMAGQVWAYSSLERGVDCSSLSTGGITCMADSGRGRGWTLQNTLNDLLVNEDVRCTRVM